MALLTSPHLHCIARTDGPLSTVYSTVANNGQYSKAPLLAWQNRWCHFSPDFFWMATKAQQLTKVGFFYQPKLLLCGATTAVARRGGREGHGQGVIDRGILAKEHNNKNSPSTPGCGSRTSTNGPTVAGKPGCCCCSGKDEV